MHTKKESVGSFNGSVRTEVKVYFSYTAYASLCAYKVFKRLFDQYLALYFRTNEWDHYTKLIY